MRSFGEANGTLRGSSWCRSLPSSSSRLRGRLAYGRAVLAGGRVARSSAAQDGLGVVMVRAASGFRVDVVFAGLIVFAGPVAVMTALVKALEDRMSRVESNRSVRRMIRLDLARARNKSAGLSLLLQGRQTVTPAGGSGMRCPRAKGSSPLHSGGIGHHVRRHYDRCARCSL